MSQSFADEDDPLLDIQKKHFFRKKGNKGKSSSVGRWKQYNNIRLRSTTYELAKNLKNINALTVITNALNVATILAEYNNINVIVPGGILKKELLVIRRHFGRQGV